MVYTPPAGEIQKGCREPQSKVFPLIWKLVIPVLLGVGPLGVWPLLCFIMGQIKMI